MHRHAVMTNTNRVEIGFAQNLNNLIKRYCLNKSTSLVELWYKIVVYQSQTANETLLDAFIYGW